MQKLWNSCRDKELTTRKQIAKETDEQIAKELVEKGYVSHRVNKITKAEQVKITDKGLVALKLLKKLSRKFK